MSRTTILVLVALGAALAGFALATNARRAQDEPSAPPTHAAAGPQKAELGWQEHFGPEGDELVFSVDSLEVLPEGWRARIALENKTSVPYEVGGPSSMAGPSFGLMLFESDQVAELEQENENGTLPASRTATHFEPSPPRLLEPGDIVDRDDLRSRCARRRQLGSRRLRPARLGRHASRRPRGARRVDHGPRVSAAAVTRRRPAARRHWRRRAAMARNLDDEPARRGHRGTGERLGGARGVGAAKLGGAHSPSSRQMTCPCASCSPGATLRPVTTPLR